MNRRTLLALGGFAAASRIVPAQAQGFPTRPLRVVIPFAAGGSTDILARICAQMLTERLGQSAVPESCGSSSIR